MTIATPKNSQSFLSPGQLGKKEEHMACKKQVKYQF